MSYNKTINEQIDEYILSHPKRSNEIGYYATIADKFSVHPERARGRYRMLTKSVCQKPAPVRNAKIDAIGGSTAIYTSSGTTLQVETKEKVENLQDLIRVCKIDTTAFSVADYEVKSYNAWIKNDANQIEKQQLYSVRASLKRKTVDNDIQKQKDIILAEIAKSASKYNYTEGDIEIEVSPIVSLNVQERQVRNHALEINIPDLHIGKLAWGKETGEDYDSEIAVDRYKKAVTDLISRVNPHILEKIILPIGNDLLQVDNSANTTTAGTHVSTDSRFGKMFQTAKKLLIDTIDKLSRLAPVEVIVIPGNHDQIATFTLGEVLDAWYNNNSRVTVFNTHTPRKYVQYGQNLIMYTHGHREKLEQLGMICATEQPQLWADTKYRRVHVGHFHHTKQIKFVDVHEQPGFTIRILNSLSSNDAWHAEKGYLSLKGAEAFLYDKDKGLVANYFYLNQ